MPDIIAKTRRPGGVSAPPAAADEILLRRPIELLFFAYRDFTGVADRKLATIGFGRAHHRALYFIGRMPGITVGELLGILRITKQSLAPVLREMLRARYIVQRADSADRRRRRLFLTGRGQGLERELTQAQSRLLAKAFAAVGADAARGFEAVLRRMVGTRDRRRFFSD
jgi:DNA-binding MarR family transcriptional regulator